MTDERRSQTDGPQPGSQAEATTGEPAVGGAQSPPTPAAKGRAQQTTAKGQQAKAQQAKAQQAKTKSKKTRTTVDEVSVSDGALAKIIGLSAHEVPGIVGMAPASFSEGIRRILGARQVDEGVVLARSADGRSADVDMHVVVAYGVNIPVVAESVRDRVKYAAKLYAGIELKKIRVHVAGVSRA